MGILDNISGSNVGSILFPLLIGAASAFAPRTTAGVMRGFSLMQGMGEKAEKKRQATTLRDFLSGGSGAPTTEKPQPTQQPQPAQAQPQPTQIQPRPVSPDQAWRGRLQKVFPPGLIQAAPDAMLPSLLGHAITAAQKPQGKAYVDPKTGKAGVLIPPDIGQPETAWRYQQVSPGVQQYGQEYDRATAVFTGGQYNTFGEFVKANPQAAAQLGQQIEARKTTVPSDANAVALRLFGKPANQLTREQWRQVHQERQNLEYRSKVTLPTEKEQQQWTQQQGQTVLHYFWDGRTLTTKEAPRSAKFHVPTILGGGEGRAESKETRAQVAFVQKLLDTLNRGSKPEQENAAQELRGLGFTITPGWWGWNVQQPQQRALPPARPPVTPSTPAPASKKQKRSAGVPAPDYQPPWASDYGKRR